MRTGIKEKLPYPIHLDIEATNYCMLKCPICPYQFMKREKGFITWKTLRKVIEESKGKTKTIYFHHMGDPLLHPELFDMIRYIKDSGMWVAISTNGVLLTENVSRKLFGVGLDFLYVSLDSLDKDVYEKIRKGASFHQTLENVEKCIKVRKSRDTFNTHLELQMIEMEYNINEVEKYKKYFNSKIEGVGKVVIKPFDRWAGQVTDRSPIPRVAKEFVCTMYNYSMTIEWNGDVNICCRDYDSFTKIGNIHKKSIKELWDSPQYEIIRKAHKEKDFSKLKYCKGCYLASQLKLGNYAWIRDRLEKQNFHPYLNKKTIKFLESVLTKKMRILETGSGASTIWFAERVKEIITFEHAISWYHVLVDIIEEKKLENVKINFDKEYPTESFSKVKGEFDLVLLDGKGGAIARTACMKVGYKNVKPGGYLLVDDTHRREEYKEGIKALENLKWEKIEFEGPDVYGEEKTAAVYKRPKND
jgi:radical SAM protein with 4Fe4S-binding SPASM domain